jgi:hypothetical protein
VLEKYKDPLLFENELFGSYGPDVAEVLLFDSSGRTTQAVNKLKLAISINPKNAQAAHLLSMIEERDSTRRAQ